MIVINFNCSQFNSAILSGLIKLRLLAFGMPKEAIRLGAADKIISLDEIPSLINHTY